MDATAAKLIAAGERVKLIAIDLDGTLLDDSKRISGRTIRALRGLSDRGIWVVIASARPPRSVRHIYQRLELDTLQINYNGALIWDEPRHTVIFHKPMSGSLVKKIVDCARGADEEIMVSCEILDRWYTDRFEQPYKTETGRLFTPDIVAPLEEFCDGPVTKLLLLGPAKLIGRLQPVLTEKFSKQVSIIVAESQLMQIMNKSVSKATALKLVAEGYGLTMEEVMALGDAPNDVAMLQTAGLAVAMDNAHHLVKLAADWVAPSNNDHGVHAALVRYGLCD